MGENDYLGISGVGYLEDIDAISAADLYAYFQQCLTNDTMTFMQSVISATNRLRFLRPTLIFQNVSVPICPAILSNPCVRRCWMWLRNRTSRSPS